MLVDLWPLFGLTIRTPRLELRLPCEQELAELAQLAGRGVHRPDERPFLTPWTDGSPTDRARFVQDRPAVTVDGMTACRPMFGF